MHKKTRWQFGVARFARALPASVWVNTAALQPCAAAVAGARGHRRVERWLDDRQPERAGDFADFKETVDPKKGKSLRREIWV